MEIIIFIAVVVVAALLWNGYVKAKKTDSDHALDNWQPPKAEDKPWPYGEKLPEGKIHVKTTDVSGSENRVEAPAPYTVTEPAAITPIPEIPESAPAKKAAAKKPAAKPAVDKKPAVTKRAPAKKKST